MTDKTMTQLAEKVGECIGLLQHLCETRLRGEECARARLAYQELRDAITRHLSQTAERGHGGIPLVCNKNICPSCIETPCRYGSETKETHYLPQSSSLPPAAGVPDGWRDALAQCVNVIEHFSYKWTGEGIHPHTAIENARSMLSATPSPTVDVAAVREVSKEASVLAAWETVQLSSEQLQAWSDKLARAIGDAK